MIWAVPSSLPGFTQIPVVEEVWTSPERCHWNVDTQVSLLGGKRIEGVYALVSDLIEEIYLVKHSVWEWDGDIIDITPFSDGRGFNVFSPLDISSPSILWSEIGKTREDRRFAVVLNKASLKPYAVPNLSVDVTSDWPVVENVSYAKANHICDLLKNRSPF